MTEETKKCQYCGETILKIAIKCKHCGSNLSESQNSYSLTGDVVNNNIIWVLALLH